MDRGRGYFLFEERKYFKNLQGCQKRLIRFRASKTKLSWLQDFSKTEIGAQSNFSFYKQNISENLKGCQKRLTRFHANELK